MLVMMNMTRLAPIHIDDRPTNFLFQLVREAMRIIDVYIHTINQKLLLEHMHATEECDVLLYHEPQPADVQVSKNSGVHFQSIHTWTRTLPPEIIADKSLIGQLFSHAYQ